MNQQSNIRRILRSKGKKRASDLFLSELDKYVSENSQQNLGQLRSNLLESEQSKRTASISVFHFIIGLIVLTALIILTWIIPFTDFTKQVLHAGLKLEFVNPTTMITSAQNIENYLVKVTQDGMEVPDGTKVIFTLDSNNESGKEKVEFFTQNGFAIYPLETNNFTTGTARLRARSNWNQEEIEIHFIGIDLQSNQGSLEISPEASNALTIHIKNNSDIALNNIICKIGPSGFLVDGMDAVNYSLNIQTLESAQEFSKDLAIGISPNQLPPASTSINISCSLQNPEMLITSMDLPVTFKRSFAIKSTQPELNIPNDGFNHDYDLSIQVTSNLPDPLTNINLTAAIEPNTIGTLILKADDGNGNYEYKLSTYGGATENARISFTLDNAELSIPVNFLQPKDGTNQPRAIVYLQPHTDRQLAILLEDAHPMVFEGTGNNSSRVIVSLDVHVNAEALVNNGEGGYTWNTQWFLEHPETTLFGFISNVSKEIGTLFSQNDFSKVKFRVNEGQLMDENGLLSITIEGWMEKSSIFTP